MEETKVAVEDAEVGPNGFPDSIVVRWLRQPNLRICAADHWRFHIILFGQKMYNESDHVMSHDCHASIKLCLRYNGD